ncbi:Uncharacterized conserved protein, contains HEPN domain [Cyclobacterium xiamenense]|uniref:Uncharacterized conserved protein, contains HEPN domain n=1 Tax=Cyclobacterium xiamenense TaxID=1297121 RepID=A0A1H7AHW1_9BACT|nr:DUF86 domain-containing protein [Cyclobacterium xiamenense]SEJ64908.1 Uncharacterized conserved protein, contains HEPN domain [Cyclobacterium xiamenense]
MRNRIGDNARLNHILNAISEIEAYLQNANYETFLKHSMMRFACIKQLEIIGEASVHISEEIKIKFREIEWDQIKGMRNSYVHEYFGIDSKLVWEIINDDLPELKATVVHILVYLSENQDF